MLNEINLNCDENVWSACFFMSEALMRSRDVTTATIG